MKKLLNFILCVTITIVVSSCKKNALSVDPNTLDNTTWKCWYVTVSQSAADIKASESWHTWDNERNLVIYLQKSFGKSGYDVSYKVDTKFVGPSDCEKAN